MSAKTRDEELKQDFIKYLQEHPELRFWQALCNWSGHAFIYVSDACIEDTYYLEGKK